MVSIKIDTVEVNVTEGTTILQAAEQAEIYIPHICCHPDLSPVDRQKPADAIYRDGERIENARPELRYEGCRLCVVGIEGQNGLHRSCSTPVADGMVAHTVSPAIEAFRRERIMELVTRHPHACLTCAQKEGCARFPCSMNIPEAERCCPRFGNCEFQPIAEYVGIKPETPRYVFEDLPIIEDNPLFRRDYNLCIGCTRCIRMCRDVCGIGALDFVYDGHGRIIVGTINTTLQESACRFCTTCVGVCPTGTLMVKGSFKEQVSSKDAYPNHSDVPRSTLRPKPALAPEREQGVEYTAENLANVPEESGVYQLLDGQKAVIYIKGALNLRKELEEQLHIHERARYFVYEKNPLYSMRESEILQHYISRHGEMPAGNREVDDLF
ncbi:MAG: 2Fe-2S iron-sulfur cluster-binding protein [Desulfobacterales bacterium]|nr:2Fe-2S iron-sulfur cluster-binding protein [Desulfobacterales bacterium]